MSVTGEGTSTSVKIAWDSLVKYSAGELTLADFFETWEIGGTPLAIPE